jgi:hypothetical protein
MQINKEHKYIMFSRGAVRYVPLKEMLRMRKFLAFSIKKGFLIPFIAVTWH